MGVLAVRMARGEDGAVGGGDMAGVSGRKRGLLVSLRRHLALVSTYSIQNIFRRSSRLAAVEHVVAGMHDLLLAEGAVLQEAGSHIECFYTVDGLV